MIDLPFFDERYRALGWRVDALTTHFDAGMPLGESGEEDRVGRETFASLPTNR
jgi:hypothetical protein